MGNTISKFNAFTRLQKFVLIASTTYLIHLVHHAKEHTPRAKKMHPFILLSMFLSIQSDFPLSYLPFTLMMMLSSKFKSLKATVESFSIGAVWSLYIMVLTKIVSLGYLKASHGWGLLYLALATAMGGKRNIYTPSIQESLIIRCLWDPPLIFIISSLRLLEGGNFISIIDENIALSRMPLAKDVKEMCADKNNIRSVVNLQREWIGPKKAYEAAGIVQLRLPIYDTFSPTLEQLKDGVAFIKRRLKEVPGSRVLIHCKGGRGRATVMAVAYYISTGMDPQEAFEKLKLNRPIVEKRVLKYPVLKEYLKECRT